MSNTQIAFLDRANVPGRDALQASIDRLGFNLKLHPEFMPFDDSGFLPFVLDGTPDVGFEVFYAPASEVTEGDEDLAAIAAGREFSISMVWRGSMKDCACAMIVSCALTRDFAAVVTYEGNPPEPFESLLENTKEVLAEAAKEKPRVQAQQVSEGTPPPKKPWWRLW
ncbi:MAG TPA: hypothetical protein VFO36_10065 [Nitrospiraceae bacterium]|nr:hypothetical protein [Nitrospiraceae bacterium]